MIAPWIDEVLAKHAVLDLHHPDARRELAAALTAAAASNDQAAAKTIADTITTSARAVLEQKIASTQLEQAVLVDREYAPRIAREIGRNAAQTVVFITMVGD